MQRMEKEKKNWKTVWKDGRTHTIQIKTITKSCLVRTRNRTKKKKNCHILFHSIPFGFGFCTAKWCIWRDRLLTGALSFVVRLDRMSLNVRNRLPRPRETRHGAKSLHHAHIFFIYSTIFARSWQHFKMFKFANIQIVLSTGITNLHAICFKLTINYNYFLLWPLQLIATN